MPKKKSGFCEWRRALRLFSDPGRRYKRAVTMRATGAAAAEVADGELPVRWLLGGVNNTALGNGFDLRQCQRFSKF